MSKTAKVDKAMFARVRSVTTKLGIAAAATALSLHRNTLERYLAMNGVSTSKGTMALIAANIEAAEKGTAAT